MSIYDKEAPTGMFLKFQAGDTHRIRLFGDAIEFEKAFVSKDGKVGEPRQRFASLVLYRDVAKGASEVKVIEFGWEIQKRLKAFFRDEDWGDPTTFDIKITATGESLQRTYEVVPVPKAALKEADANLVSSCSLDLKEICLKDGAKASGAVAATDEYDPFSES